VTLKTQMTSDLSVFFNTDEHATEVTYTPAVGDASTVDAVIDYGEEGDNDGRGSHLSEATLYCKKSAISSPAYRETFTIGGETWTIRQILRGDDDLVWHIRIQQEERPVI